MPFVKLKRGNNWMVEFFMLEGGSTGDQRNEIKFTEGQPVSVRYPDGSCETETVVLRQCSGSYSDHGHAHTVSYALAGIMVSARGLQFWVPLDRVEVELVDKERAG